MANDLVVEMSSSEENIQPVNKSFLEIVQEKAPEIARNFLDLTTLEKKYEHYIRTLLQHRIMTAQQLNHLNLYLENTLQRQRPLAKLANTVLQLIDSLNINLALAENEINFNTLLFLVDLPREKTIEILHEKYLMTDLLALLTPIDNNQTQALSERINTFQHQAKLAIHEYQALSQTNDTNLDITPKQNLPKKKKNPSLFKKPIAFFKSPNKSKATAEISLPPIPDFIAEAFISDSDFIEQTISKISTITIKASAKERIQAVFLSAIDQVLSQYQTNIQIETDKQSKRLEIYKSTKELEERIHIYQLLLGEKTKEGNALDLTEKLMFLKDKLGKLTIIQVKTKLQTLCELNAIDSNSFSQNKFENIFKAKANNANTIIKQVAIPSIYTNIPKNLIIETIDTLIENYFHTRISPLQALETRYLDSLFIPVNIFWQKYPKAISKNSILLNKAWVTTYIDILALIISEFYQNYSAQQLESLETIITEWFENIIKPDFASCIDAISTSIDISVLEKEIIETSTETKKEIIPPIEIPTVKPPSSPYPERTNHRLFQTRTPRPALEINKTSNYNKSEILLDNIDTELPTLPRLSPLSHHKTKTRLPTPRMNKANTPDIIEQEPESIANRTKQFT